MDTADECAELIARYEREAAERAQKDKLREQAGALQRLALAEYWARFGAERRRIADERVRLAREYAGGRLPYWQRVEREEALNARERDLQARPDEPERAPKVTPEVTRRKRTATVADMRRLADRIDPD